MDRQTQGHLTTEGLPELIVTATKDTVHLYVEVINRTPKLIKDHLELEGATVQGPPTIYLMANGLPPKDARPTRLGTSFDFEFPPLSATIFRFPLKR